MLSRPVKAALLFGLALAVLAGITSAYAQRVVTPGTACSVVDAAFWEQSSICNTTSGQWQRPAFQFGAAIATCAAGTAGMVQWTGSALQYCNGTSWVGLGSSYLGASTATTSPSRSDDVTTGLFSSTASTVAIATAGVEALRVTATGSVGIGTTTPTAGAKLDITGTGTSASSIILPRDTTANRPTGVAGMMRYNTTKNAMEWYNGTTWISLTCADTTPLPFSFTDQSDVTKASTISSNNVILLGFTSTLSAVCSNCTDIAINGTWLGKTTATGVKANDTIAIRITSTGDNRLNRTATGTATVGSTTSSVWTVETNACSNQAIGTACSDNTVYAGLSTDGNIPMYTTRCDYGRIWGGSSCSGTPTTGYWDSSTPHSFLGVTDQNTGDTNTATLAALGSRYLSAYYCDALSSDGYTDWYLPASLEGRTLYDNRAAIGGFYAATYWSSTESNTATGALISGGSSNKEYGSGFYFRCVRHD